MKHPEIVQRILCGVAREQDFETIGLDNALAIKRDSGEVHYRFCERGVRRGEDEEDSTYKHDASTEHVDGMGDILKVPGWDLIRLKTGRVSLLWSHESMLAPLGLVLSARKNGRTNDGVRSLETTSRVHEDEIYGDSEYGKHVATIRRLMDRGHLPGVSVGFIPKKGRQPELEEREKLGMTVPWGMIFEEQELLELSVTSTPANGHAQQKTLDRFDVALREMVSKGEIAEAFAATLRESLVVSEERWAERIAKIGRTIVPLSKELPWTRGASAELEVPAAQVEVALHLLDKDELRAAVREAVQESMGSVIREFIEPLEASILEATEHLAASRDAAKAEPSERADDHVKHAPDGAPARTDASTGTSRNPTNPTPRIRAEEAFLRGIEAATSAARNPDDRSAGDADR